jgi:NAD(P)-dependent dehydrogenase (short-subunit alcohol dehydrogenase family)
VTEPPWLPSQRLDGEHALITGAGRGIGRAVALALAEAGATSTLVARSVEELESVAAEIRAIGGAADVCPGDVTSPVAVERAVAVADAGGRLSLCVNAAGLNRTGPTAELALADWDIVLDTNLRGTFLVCQAAGARMLARGHGRIVNVSSQMGSVGYPGRAAYCASKHAVDGLTRALGVEWAPHGVLVNAVAPTFIRTPLTAPMFADAAFEQEVLRRIPAGRIGEVREVTGAVVFLLSNQATLFAGQILGADGGWTAW